MEIHTVRLDMSKLPIGDNLQHALSISEALLHICGLIEIWVEPKHEHRIFCVRNLPQDVPQAGVYWLDVRVEKGNGVNWQTESQK